MKYSHDFTSFYKPILSICFIMLLVPGFVAAQTNVLPAPVMPQLVEEGIVSTAMYERDMAISPDGKEMFYTVQVRPAMFQTLVYRHKLENGRWSAPQIAGFSGHYSDLEPAFSADGKKLFFCSNRPLSGQQSKDFDIWYVEKQNGQWAGPRNLGPSVNAGGDEFYPSVAQNGNLYFTATRKNGIGKEDIFVARWQNGKYQEPEPLDEGVNSKTYEFNAFISPDEQFILFTSYGRSDDKGGGDLYISIKDANGLWQPAINCTMLNSDKLDYCPFVSFDKKTLYFTSERHNFSSSFPGKAITFSELQQMSTGALNGSGNIYHIPFNDVLKALKQ
jgi:Tol biopolymer transport system component